MKRIALILALCVALSPACLAETSSTDRFLSSLSETWDAFLGMAEDAGNGVSRWVEESGVVEWAEGAVNDLSAWAAENGLNDWAENTLTALKTWFDESGLAEWTAQTSEEVQAFVEENRATIEAWLAEAGDQVRSAWDTLLDAGAHTPEEVREAYETVAESLETAEGPAAQEAP